MAHGGRVGVGVRRGGKASLSTSSISRPQSPIHKLVQKFQDYLHFPDPAPMYAVMATLAANMLHGNPVWTMLVGSPGCGKTELLRSVMGLEGMVEAGSIKGPSALLSGVPARDIKKGATGGLLREVGDAGCLVFKDFTSVLSLPREPLSEVLGAFREVYDGGWTRNVGSDGGKKLTWTGKLAMLGGCTQAIDRQHVVSAEMGERWVFFRYKETSGYQEGRIALGVMNPAQARDLIQAEVRDFFDTLGLDWHAPRNKRQLSQRETDRIIAMATLSARCRSVVVRNNWSHEIEDVPQREAPTRLITVLGQLYLGCEAIGLTGKESWSIIGQIAMDCMPQVRRRAVECVMDAKLAGRIGVGLDRLLGAMQISTTTAKRVLEDLTVHDVLDKRGGSTWELSAWATNEIEQGW